jgi:hypothetical protein
VRQNELVAAGILLASSAAFGYAMSPVFRGERHATEYTDAMLESEPFKEWVTAVLAIGLASLSVDAFGRWVGHYASTGEMMSPEEIERLYH